ncbi:TPM domain-containing protein [Paenibacillus sp. PK4536]|uniref:TPM domain-containing protein n=1 Tax=Paenibacillus sp. PK4536 TaxID=3024576 RepID=UPI002358D1C4|nr:TPM domain-containing protein [Paenibacillus sp. PK4536]WIM40079.1 TPM domain-containing protein [Paenibacillus sp. PK4536]
MKINPKTFQKWLPLLLICWLITQSMTGIAYGAQQKGFVLDDAGLFSSSEIDKLNTELSGQEYQMYVNTATGMDEAQGLAYANQIYDGSNLGKNDIVLVITTNPNYVHLVFQNAVLANKIANSNERTVQGVTDNKFVPSAQDGDIVGGVLAVNRYINHVPLTTVISQKLAQVGLNWGSAIALLIGGIALIWFVIWLMIRLNKVSKLKVRRQQVQLHHDQIATSLNSLIVSDLFKELEMGFVTGQTKEMIEQLQSQLMKEHARIADSQQKIDAIRLSIGAVKKSASDLTIIEQEQTQWATDMANVQKHHQEMDELSRTVRGMVEASKANLEQVKNTVATLEKQYNYPLTAMKDRITTIEHILQEADQLDEFDFMKAKEPAERANQLLDVLVEDIRLYGEWVQRSQRYTAEINNTEQELRPVVEREHLKLTIDDPFRILEHARTEEIRLVQLLAGGNIDLIRQSMEMIEQDIAAARQVVSDLINFRDESKKTLTMAQQQMADFRNMPEMYNQEVSRLQAEYAGVHLREQGARYQEIQKMQGEVNLFTPQIVDALHDEVQQYRQAYTWSEQVRNALSRMQQLRTEIMSYKDQLDNQKQSEKQRLDKLREDYRRANEQQAAISVNPDDTQQVQAHSYQALEQAEQILSGTLLNMVNVKEVMDTAERETVAFVQRVEELTQQRQEAIEAIEGLLQEHRNLSARYFTTAITTHVPVLHRLVEELQQLVNQGYFVQAQQKAQEGAGILQFIALEYKALYDQEQERKRRQRSSGGGSGGSSSGGGSRSSSSSSWSGGSSRSSGSSKW